MHFAPLPAQILQRSRVAAYKGIDHLAEHGKLTLSGDPADENTVFKLTPEMDHISFQPIRTVRARTSCHFSFNWMLL